ncbi:MAG: NADH-quinone oxidoreductase subunit A [Alphaproteobacteria bacterium]
MVTIPDGYLGFFLFFVLIFIIIMPLVSFFIAKKITDNNQKISEIRKEKAFFNGYFSFQNFPVAIVFVVFSPVMVFFMLWAVSLFNIGWKLFFVILAYFLIQLFTLVYVLCKGGFEWKR